jgi:putative tryptophan/tyrosine transport system substrate-binding protein
MRDPTTDVSPRRIAYLDPGSPDSRPREIDAFRDQLRELGYGEGRDIVIDYRYAFGVAERLVLLAEELVEQGPEVIVAFGTQSVEAAQDATEAAGTPIVMASSSDPVGSNLVQTLAQPGGRITGLTSAAPQLTGKRLQLLTESFPRTSRVAYLWDSRSSGDYEERAQLELAASRLGVALIPLDVLGSSQRFDALFAEAANNQADALMAFASGLINNYPAPIVSFTRERSIPAMYAQREFVTEHGGLMAYGPSYPDMYRRAAIFVDKILSGAKPAQLPVEKPRRFRFVVNQDAARAVELTMPRPLLVQVDEIV